MPVMQERRSPRAENLGADGNDVTVLADRNSHGRNAGISRVSDLAAGYNEYLPERQRRPYGGDG